jgi:hypothetical protein
LELAIGPSIDLEALLVDRTVVAPTEQREVRKRGGPALGPVVDVMALAKADSTARKAAPAVSVVERPA